ncbi:MAG: phosphoribosylglycinamide formyltransferase [Saprospiraceae bacterium]|nr:phosphoribosylglycinamide formyltransferase [Saprospiraceae bacterium]
MSKPFNITVLISGGGSNLQAIIDAIDAGQLEHVHLLKVIADRPAGGLERAEKQGIPNELIARKVWRQQLSEKVVAAIPPETDLVVLAGYLSIVGTAILNQFKVINIHPALLPKYGGKGMYGINVHRAVIENKEVESGCTVHYVDAGVDTGEIIAQAKVNVDPSDTPEMLQQRVLIEEHRLLPKVLALLATSISL